MPALLLFTAGCAGAVDDVAGSAPAGASSGEPEREVAPLAPAPLPRAENRNVQSNVPPALLEGAIADAARRASVDRAAVKVVRAEAVTWPDGSMGCPQPGMAYTLALVPGFRIQLEAGGQVLNYHASARGNANFCPAERVTNPVPGTPPAGGPLDPT